MYSKQFATKQASDEHDERMKELKEIQDGLENDNFPTFAVAKRLARVIELLLEEIE